MNANPYEVLGVPATASQAEIKARYRYLCHAFHPDKFTAEAHRQAAENDFKRINAAYEILSDPVQRQLYDASNSRPRSSPPPPPPEYKYQSPPSQPPPSPSSSQYEQPPAPLAIAWEIIRFIFFPFRIARIHFILRYCALLGAMNIFGKFFFATFRGDEPFHLFGPSGMVMTLAVCFFAFFLIWGMSVPRLRDMGSHGACCLLLFVPFFNIPIMFMLALSPTKHSAKSSASSE